MTDDNIIGIDGRHSAQLRAEQAEREKREEILRQKLKCLGFELRPENMPGSYTIAHPHPPQPPYLNGWRDLSLDQVEDATSDIEIGQDPRFGCGALRAVRFGKPWRLRLPECYVERLDALKHYYYELSVMRADLVSIREGLWSPESGKATTASTDIRYLIACALRSARIGKSSEGVRGCSRNIARQGISQRHDCLAARPACTLVG
jgi:hypothetical protein